MKTNLLTPAKAAFVAVLILVGTAVPALSQPVKIRPCEVQSVDCTNMTITVQTINDKETFTLYVTSQTRLYRNGKPAITCDFQPGDLGHGSAYTNADNKVEAVRFYAKETKQIDTP